VRGAYRDGTVHGRDVSAAGNWQEVVGARVTIREPSTYGPLVEILTERRHTKRNEAGSCCGWIDNVSIGETGSETIFGSIALLNGSKSDECVEINLAG
jgi:hypothetical protein